MPDDVTNRFFAWADQRGMKREEIAEILKVEKRSVSTYRGSGLPNIKKHLAERLIQGDLVNQESPIISDAEISALQELTDGLVLHPSEEQFDAWTAAFKHSSAQNLREWAINGLNELASYSPKVLSYEPITSDHKYWIDLVAGVAAGAQITSDVAPEPIPVSEKYDSDCYALRVFGQSMEPKIPDESIIIVREWKEGFPRKGTIVVYSDGMGMTLKEFGYRKARPDEEGDSFGNVPVLRSLNKAFPDVQTMEGGKIDAVFVEVL